MMAENEERKCGSCVKVIGIAALVGFLAFVGLVILIGMPERRVGRIAERQNALTAKDWETRGLGYPSVAWRGGDR